MKMDEKGFTLTETLLVLTIFLIISFVTIFAVKPQYVFMEKTLFFSRLEADLYYVQQYAISHQREVSINFMPDEKYYYVRDRSDGSIVIERNYSELITVKEGSQKLFFKFTASGQIDRFGSIYISIGKDMYRMTFLLGEGRFYVTKE